MEVQVYNPAWGIKPHTNAIQIARSVFDVVVGREWGRLKELSSQWHITILSKDPNTLLLYGNTMEDIVAFQKALRLRESIALNPLPSCEAVHDSKN